MVERTGPDRPVQPVGPGTGHSTGPELLQNRLSFQTGKNRYNPVGPADSVKPAHPRLNQFFPAFYKNQYFFFAMKILNTTQPFNSILDLPTPSMLFYKATKFENMLKLAMCDFTIFIL